MGVESENAEPRIEQWTLRFSVHALPTELARFN
jgi:hypothetical protein